MSRPDYTELKASKERAILKACAVLLRDTGLGMAKAGERMAELGYRVLEWHHLDAAQHESEER